MEYEAWVAARNQPGPSGEEKTALLLPGIASPSLPIPTELPRLRPQFLKTYSQTLPCTTTAKTVTASVRAALRSLLRSFKLKDVSACKQTFQVYRHITFAAFRVLAEQTKT
jgi:hypothetical protein